MFYRGVIVPGGKVAHESLRLRCKFQWEHKCLLVLMVWFLLYSSGDWLACFKCKRGMYFSKFSGSLNETCFYYGFSASSYAQGWLENYGIFFVYRTLAYETLRRSSCLFRLPAVRAKSKWESWTGQNPIFWSGSCVVRIWWSPLDRGIWNLCSPPDRGIWNLWLGMLTGPWPISCKIVSCLLHKPFVMSSANDWFCIFWGLSYRAAQQRYIV